MTQRSFDDAFWGDELVQELKPHAKLLFIYLWTNKACNSAGVYRITLKTISFETGLEISELETLFNSLKSKITWYSAQNIVWVHTFLKHQTKSNLFLKSVISVLNALPSEIKKSFLVFNAQYGFVYDIDTDSITYIKDNDRVSDTFTKVPTLILSDNNIDNTMNKHDDSITQDILSEKVESEIDRKVRKRVFGEFQNVLLTDEEKEKLESRYNEKQVNVMIESLSAYLRNHPKKYKDHYATLCQWFMRELKSQNNGNGHKNESEIPQSKYSHMVKRR